MNVLVSMVAVLKELFVPMIFHIVHTSFFQMKDFALLQHILVLFEFRTIFRCSCLLQGR